MVFSDVSVYSSFSAFSNDLIGFFIRLFEAFWPLNCNDRHEEGFISIEIPLETLSVSEKIRLPESVWDSLCSKSGDVRSPEWHREVLETRKRRLEDGRATVSSWSEAKARLLEVGR